MTSQRYRRVIVGFDGSPAAVAALDWASAEARLHGASLVICTVVPDGQEPATSDALATLRRSVQELIGGEPEVRCVPGSPAVALITACTPSDLLVLGAHGRSALAGVLLGSVSRACLHRAPCPVAVVPATGERPRHDRVIAAVALHRVERTDLIAGLPQYAATALTLAEQEVPTARDAGDPAAVMAAVVTGTVLGEALLTTLRLLAHEHVSATLAGYTPAQGPGCEPPAGDPGEGTPPRR